MLLHLQYLGMLLQKGEAANLLIHYWARLMRLIILIKASDFSQRRSTHYPEVLVLFLLCFIPCICRFFSVVKL